MICSFHSLQPYVASFPNQASHDLFDFQFPSLTFILSQWTSFFQIQKEITRHGYKAFFKSGKIFKRIKQKHQNYDRLVFQCSEENCKARLQYQDTGLNQPSIRVIAFNNSHSHKKTKNPDLAKRQDISLFILSLDEKDIEMNASTSTWTNKFQLGKTKALSIIQSCFWRNNSEQQILSRLVFNQQIKIRRYREDKALGRTNLIFLSTETMKKTYMKYGQVVCLGMTDKILIQQSSYNQKYTTGCFFAQDQNLRLLLVGCFVLTHKSEDNFFKLFEFFEECVCENRDLTQTYVVDSLPCLNTALEKFKIERDQKFEILNDWLHVVQRDFKPYLKELRNGKQILDLITATFTERLEQQTKENLSRIQQMLGEQNKQIYESLITNLHRYCLAKMPNKFQGFAMSSKFIKDMELRTNKLPYYRNHTGRLFYQYLFMEDTLLRLSNSIVSISKIGPIKHYANEMIFLREKMEKKVMQVLITKFTQSKQLQRQKIDAITYRLKPDTVQPSDKKSAIVKFNLEFDHWECQCRYIYLCGIPCQHIIHMITLMKGAVSYYINSRWYHSKQHLVLNKMPTGPRISTMRRRK